MASQARANGGAADVEQVRERKPQASTDRIFAADSRAHVLWVVSVEGDRDASGDELADRVLSIRACAAEQHIRRQTALNGDAAAHHGVEKLLVRGGKDGMPETADARQRDRLRNVGLRELASVNGHAKSGVGGARGPVGNAGPVRLRVVWVRDKVDACQAV